MSQIITLFSITTSSNADHTLDRVALTPIKAPLLNIGGTTKNKTIRPGVESTHGARLTAGILELLRCWDVRRVTPAQGSVTLLSSASWEPNL